MINGSRAKVGVQQVLERRGFETKRYKYSEQRSSGQQRIQETLVMLSLFEVNYYDSSRASFRRDEKHYSITERRVFFLLGGYF